MEIDLEKLFGSKKKTVWDKVVPIVRNKKGYHCYLASEVAEPQCYNELCMLLENATAFDTIVLHINTPGGHLDSAFKILAGLKNTKAKTRAVLTGTVASAGTIISLACDELQCEPYTHFMIHNYSTGTQGKGHEIMEYINFTDKNLRKTFKEIYGGFLTPQEITAVIKGKDMWLETEDVISRWERMQKKDK